MQPSIQLDDFLAAAYNSLMLISAGDVDAKVRTASPLKWEAWQRLYEDRSQSTSLEDQQLRALAMALAFGAILEAPPDVLTEAVRTIQAKLYAYGLPSIIRTLEAETPPA